MTYLRPILSEGFAVPLMVGIGLFAFSETEWVLGPNAGIETHQKIAMLAFCSLMSLFEYLILLVKQSQIGSTYKTTIWIISITYSLQMLILLPFTVGWLFFLGYVMVITPAITADGNVTGELTGQAFAYLVVFAAVCIIWRFFFYHYMAIARLLSRWILRTEDPRAVVRLIDYIYYLTGAVSICLYLAETNADRNIDPSTTAIFIAASMIILGLRFSKVTLELRDEQFTKSSAGIRSISGTPIWPASSLENWIENKDES